MIGKKIIQISENIYAIDSLSKIPISEWNKCAQSKDRELNPFISHEFLSSLEESDSVSEKTGFQPLHIVIKDKSHKLIGCCPLYLKSHSYGEYIFDWNWAQAYENAGGKYYPKLLCGVPFTPVTSPRFLIKNKKESNKITEQLLTSMKKLVNDLGVSSLHITFPEKEELYTTEKLGFLTRVSQQFHWKNNNYNDFNDFLAELSSRKRKNIKKERKLANSLDIDFLTLTGNDIKKEHWDAFYQFYLNTIDKKWGTAYLNRSFFEILSNKIPEKIVLIIGKRKKDIICGALNFLGDNTLYGRNWGSIVNEKMIHFEVCYYRAIDFAIKHKLSTVEAGAQGLHKLQRGYLPKKTYSSHWINNMEFRDAIKVFLKKEKKIITDEIKFLNNKNPFKS